MDCSLTAKARTGATGRRPTLTGSSSSHTPSDYHTSTHRESLPRLRRRTDSYLVRPRAASNKQSPSCGAGVDPMDVNEDDAGRLEIKRRIAPL